VIDILEKEWSEEDRDEPLQRIDDQHCDTGALPESAHDVGGTDIATADFANINAAGPTPQIARGD
jgi:hypothetical protein